MVLFIYAVCNIPMLCLYVAFLLLLLMLSRSLLLNRVPKLAPPSASNTPNSSVWSYGFQRNIVHCTTLTLLTVTPIMTYTLVLSVTSL